MYEPSVNFVKPPAAAAAAGAAAGTALAGEGGCGGADLAGEPAAGAGGAPALRAAASAIICCTLKDCMFSPPGVTAPPSTASWRTTEPGLVRPTAGSHGVPAGNHISSYSDSGTRDQFSPVLAGSLWSNTSYLEANHGAQ